MLTQIEVNLHFLIADVSEQKSEASRILVKGAKAIYDENVNSYARLVLRRPFAKIIVSTLLHKYHDDWFSAGQNYFEGVEQLLKTGPAEAVSKNSAYSRPALKRLLKEYTAKDVRKHIDILFKRVEKHFMDVDSGPSEGPKGSAHGTRTFSDVWKVCETECVKATREYADYIKQCYGDSGISLEYSTQDVETAFRRHGELKWCELS